MPVSQSLERSIARARAYGDAGADIGFSFAIYRALTSLIAVRAMEAGLHRLKNDGDGEPAGIPMFDFKQFCGMIGFQYVWDFEKRWAK